MINYDEQNFLKIGAHIYSKKAQIEKIADEAIDLIADAQCPDGYFNTYFLSINRFQI